MSPYEEMQVLEKQIGEVFAEIAELYKRMSKRRNEYFWTTVEREIDWKQARVKELRAKLKDATYRFVNWQEK